MGKVDDLILKFSEEVEREKEKEKEKEEEVKKKEFAAKEKKLAEKAEEKEKEEKEKKFSERFKRAFAEETKDSMGRITQLEEAVAKQGESVAKILSMMENYSAK